MTNLKIFTFNNFQENTYLLYDETNEAIIIDAGCYEKREQELLSDFIKEKNLIVKALLSTHSHIDHVLGNAFVKKTFDVKLYIHKKDEETLRSVKVYAPVYGFQMYEATEPDEFLEENNMFYFGKTQLKVLFVPGHAPGHIAFYNENEKFIIGGDVLFRSSIGRTDLPNGDFNTLINSIRTQFFTLPDDVTVFPGHGQKTTIGYEKKYNPFLT